MCSDPTALLSCLVFLLKYVVRIGHRQLWNEMKLTCKAQIKHHTFWNKFIAADMKQQKNKRMYNQQEKAQYYKKTENFTWRKPERMNQLKMLQKVNKYFYEIICNALASNWLKEFLSDLNLSGVFKCLHHRFGRETIANIINEGWIGGWGEKFIFWLTIQKTSETTYFYLSVNFIGWQKW